MAQTPSFYDPARIGTLFYPDVNRIAKEAAQANLPPSANDKEKVHLLIVDMQVDFCHERGTLHVAGAQEDIRRLIEFLYRHAERITSITCSLDSHLPHQIFHPAWWVNENGAHPKPMTTISHDDVRSGKWRPLQKRDWSVRYVKKLEEQAKKQLTIWPYHAPIGGVGNALDPELWSAVFWHSIARRSQPTWWTKGSIPETEHYSIVQPEIPVPGHPLGGKSKPFLELLERHDRILIAGEAESHCVLETVEDLVEEFADQPRMLERIYVLQDCTSPVQHPEIDFHKIALEQFETFRKRGVRFIKSTEELPF